MTKPVTPASKGTDMLIKLRFCSHIVTRRHICSVVAKSSLVFIAVSGAYNMPGMQ
jgi:hypothetical protein